MRRKIYIDFDGCIYDTIQAICNLYNDDFQYYSDYHYVNAKDVKSWDFDELNCANRDYINTYFNQQRFFEQMTFMPNVRVELSYLYDFKNIDIYIVSMGHSPNLRAKEKFIQKFLPYCHFIGVNFKEHSNKSHIDMSDGVAFIDDSSQNLITSNCPRKILYGEQFPWNNNWDGEKLINWRKLNV